MQCNFCPINCIKDSTCGLYPQRGLEKIVDFKIINDYIERFDFFHFKPNTKITMIILPGCNQLCVFCPEYKIVLKQQIVVDQSTDKMFELIDALSKSDSSIFGFYCNSTIHINAIKKLRSLFPDKEFIALSNGLINEHYFNAYISLLSAINIIFLGFSPQSYAKLSVYPYTYRNALKLLSYAHSRIHTEVTYIVTPGITKKEEFEDFLKNLSSIDVDIPLHLKRFYPNFVELDRRPTRTKDLMEYYHIAKRYLNYVYAEIWGAQPNNTYCPNGHLLIQRLGWKVIKKYIVENKCPICGINIPLVP